MIGITFIGSGSKGNSALIELNSKFFLLDAGLSCKKIRDFLISRALDLENLSGIFLTHEHEDHTKGLRVILSRCSNTIPVYTTRGTICALKARGIEPVNHVEMRYGRAVEIEDSVCTPFRVPHDATEPMGLRFVNSEKVMSIATDLGHVTPEVIENLQDADIICIESNYDEGMLRSSLYPLWLKRRIRSPMGHLPNEGVRGILSRMNKVPEALVLMHISQESNTPALARAALDPFLENSGRSFKSTRISLTYQDAPGERITTGNLLKKSLKQKLLSTDICQPAGKLAKAC